MKNYYSILGVSDFAPPEEVKRAYRILARRYHPDLNPGKESSDKFKEIAEAHEILSNLERKKSYDLTLEDFLRKEAFDGGSRSFFGKMDFGSADPNGQAEAGEVRQERYSTPDNFVEFIQDSLVTVGQTIYRGWETAVNFLTKKEVVATSQAPETPMTRGVMIVEVSISIEEAIKGIKKSIEVSAAAGTKKVSVVIPPGVRDGTPIRLKRKGEQNEDLVIVVKLVFHPYLRLLSKGLVIEIPITVNEAISGASLVVPSIDGEETIVIPAGSQSGNEIRLKGKGLKNKDGSRGDYFVRLLVYVPDEPNAVGIKDRALALEQYYPESLRKKLPKKLFEDTV